MIPKPISDLSDLEFTKCFSLLETNMKDYYRDAFSIGWNEDDIKDEMKEEGAIYLIHPHAFLLFQYSSDMENDVAVPCIYLYQLQVEAGWRGKGLGKKLMEAYETLGKLNGFNKSKLTVFTANKGAMRLYAGLGYSLDVTDPEDHSYQILSKVI